MGTTKAPVLPKAPQQKANNKKRAREMKKLSLNT
jgi:hypothetical protein